MKERRVDVTVSIGCVVAYTLWTMSLGLWAASLFWMGEQTGRLSLIVCGAAVTATIRTYFVVLNRRIKMALATTLGDATIRRVR